jgi:vitamin B12 transporter
MKKRQGVVVMAVVLAGGLAMGETNVAVSTSKPIVVTATRVAVPANTVGSSMTVVDSAQLRERQCVSIVDALRGVPGMDVNQSGGRGGIASGYIRGSQSEQILVLVDGVELNDPVKPGRGVDLSEIPIENVDRIEVLRGPQSTLYGADAIGGVVNIITKKGKGPVGGNVKVEGGSFNTWNESLEVRGGNERGNFSVGASREDSDGISSASEKNGNTEKDGYDRTELSGRFGWTPAEEFGADAVVRWSRSNSDYDGFENGLPVDSDDRAEQERLLVSGNGRLELFDGVWRQRVGGALVDHQRDDFSSMGSSSFDSQLAKVDWQHDLYLGENNILTAGLEYEEEKAESVYEAAGYIDRFDQHTARNKAAYVQDYVTAGQFSAVAGMRVDDHNAFGSESTWRVAPVYAVKGTGTRIKASYGTGFKAPSLFQLYSVYGSPDVDPETSRGWDAGVEQDLMDGAFTVGVTYFHNAFEDLINYDYSLSKYNNIGEAEAQGVEAFVTARPVKDLTLRGSYTYTETENKETGKVLERRPRNKATLDATYAVTVKARATASLMVVGESADIDFATSETVTLDRYLLATLAAEYDVRNNVTLFGRVENLFDEEYEQVFGYGTPGRAGYGGIRMTF